MSELNELATALAAAQLELKNPTFDSKNPHFKNKFASLASVRAAVVPVLNRHGIAVLQNLVGTDHGVGCETILLHTSGQMLKLGPLNLPATKMDAQGFGSAATYARRYHLMAVACVVGDDDDDAEHAVQTHEEEQAAPTTWTNANMRKHYATEIARMWGSNDAHGLRQLWDELNTEQRADVWRDFSAPQRREIKEMLKVTDTPAQEKAA